MFRVGPFASAFLLLLTGHDLNGRGAILNFKGLYPSMSASVLCIRGEWKMCPF